MKCWDGKRKKEKKEENRWYIWFDLYDGFTSDYFFLFPHFTFRSWFLLKIIHTLSLDKSSLSAPKAYERELIYTLPSGLIFEPSRPSLQKSKSRYDLSLLISDHVEIEEKGKVKNKREREREGKEGRGSGMSGRRLERTTHINPHRSIFPL